MANNDEDKNKPKEKPKEKPKVKPTAIREDKNKIETR